MPAAPWLFLIVLDQWYSKSPAPIKLETFGYIGLTSLVAGTAGALAALFTSWMAGPKYSARWLAFLTVAAMYAGGVVGTGLNQWNRPYWHMWFSFGGGAVAGVLLLVLLLRANRSAL